LNRAVLPETTHTALVEELKVTGRPELATAVIGNEIPTVCVPIALKAIVCQVRRLGAKVRVALALVWPLATVSETFVEAVKVEVLALNVPDV
jgi:hypothetical protein